MQIVRRVIRMSGGVADAELMRCNESGELRFRQYFEQHGFAWLDFEEERNIIEFLNNHCAGKEKPFRDFEYIEKGTKFYEWDRNILYLDKNNELMFFARMQDGDDNAED